MSCCLTTFLHFFVLWEAHWDVSISFELYWLVLLWSRPSHCTPRPRNRQQPYWHHDHPVQQHRQGPVQSLHASRSQWTRLFAAETQWRAGILRAVGHCQPHWWSIWENGEFGLLRFLTIWRWDTTEFSDKFINKKIYTFSQVYVAAFSIAGYAWASWRYRYKPFNPVLGETYESQREDRGFHYISEQVTSIEGYRHMMTKPQHLGLEQTDAVLYVLSGQPSPAHLCLPCRIRKLHFLAR